MDNLQKYNWRNTIEQHGSINVLAVLSSHGFGHAARSSAIINALYKIYGGNLEIDLLTGTPDWFFKTSLDCSFQSYHTDTDIGLVQTTPLEEDLAATAKALQHFYPISENQLHEFEEVLAFNQPYDAVLCDIAPLGILLAQKWDCPSILVENFTWPWIYRSYPDPPQELIEISEYLESIYRQATLHIQAQPYCKPQTGTHIKQIPVIARSARKSKKQVREVLGFGYEFPMVLASMGGIPDRYDCVEQLRKLPYNFVLAGAHTTIERVGNCLLLPHQSDWYHPDLVHAADALVGKLGYSTLAEVTDANIGFVYLTRPHFPESPVLQEFVEANLASHQLSAEDFYHGNWQPALNTVLNTSKAKSHLTVSTDGARKAASLILQVIKAHS